jgi:NAD(P)-dependent dehydrogenase (short-subunit alcohol dehydrogenase family)
VEWVSGDLSDPAVPARLVEETAAALGRLDVLVNNAGITVSKPALELTEDDSEHEVAPGRLRKHAAVSGQRRQLVARWMNAVRD